jgi:hypothetical protein
MDLNLRAIAEYARTADTEVLLDRVTVYRDDTEPAAVDLFENELSRRRVTEARIAAHASERRAAGLFDEGGIAVRCEKCERPAVARVRGWHRLAGRVPVFPRTIAYCAEHQPAAG